MPKRKRKDPAAVKLGRRGGKARMRTLNPEERSELGRQAVQKRWENAKNGVGK